MIINDHDDRQRIHIYERLISRLCFCAFYHGAYILQMHYKDSFSRESHGHSITRPKKTQRLRQMFPDDQRYARRSYPSRNRDFLQIGIDEWQEASKVLTPSAFKIYLYLASNKDGFTFALSKQDIKDKLGISFSRYYEAISLMRKLHFICCDGSNHFQFFLTPNPEFEKTHEIKDWESEQYELKSVNDDPKTILYLKSIVIEHLYSLFLLFSCYT